MRQGRMILFAGIIVAATGMIWLLSISYGPPPRATLIPMEENSAAESNNNNGPQPRTKNFPTIGSEEVAELIKNAVTNEDHGIRVEFVKSYKGYFTGGIAPANAEGEGAPPDPNALLLSSTRLDVFRHRIIICGPNGICVDDSQGGGPIFAATNGTSDDYQTIFYQFYPLNEVNWSLGDAVNIWILVSNAARDGSPVGELQWVSLGEVTIKECNSQEWCPNE